MSNAKPYLFGAALGASAMYIALQYHVVHSHDGFQMVPRTPQHSIGLAYADVRSWTPSQWTDRPELARALMAHGSSDLISQSVATSLADSVAEENSTLDQLRSFLTKPVQNSQSDSTAAGLLPIPSTSRQPLSTENNEDDLSPLPFPQDPRSTSVADPFRVAQSNESSADSTPAGVTSGETTSRNSRFTAADIIEGLRSDSDIPVDSFTSTNNSQFTTENRASGSPTTTTAKTSTTAQLAKAMEDRIFGNSTAPTSATTKPASTDAGQSMFEEVSSQLESRAQAALNRAQAAATEKASNMPANTAEASANYLRRQIEQSTPEAVKSLIQNGINSTGNEVTSSGTSLLEQFDPFLE